MKKSTMLVWCVVALMAGIGLLVVKGVTVGGLAIFVGLPLLLMVLVWCLYPAWSQGRGDV